MAVLNRCAGKKREAAGNDLRSQQNRQRQAEWEEQTADDPVTRLDSHRHGHAGADPQVGTG